MKSSSLRHFFTIYTAIFQLHDRDLLKTREYVILQALEDKGRGPNFSQFHGFFFFFFENLAKSYLGALISRGSVSLPPTANPGCAPDKN